MMVGGSKAVGAGDDGAGSDTDVHHGHADC